MNCPLLLLSLNVFQERDEIFLGLRDNVRQIIAQSHIMLTFFEGIYKYSTPKYVAKSDRKVSVQKNEKVNYATFKIRLNVKF